VRRKNQIGAEGFEKETFLMLEKNFIGNNEMLFIHMWDINN